MHSSSAELIRSLGGGAGGGGGISADRQVFIIPVGYRDFTIVVVVAVSADSSKCEIRPGVNSEYILFAVAALKFHRQGEVSQVHVAVQVVDKAPMKVVLVRGRQLRGRFEKRPEECRVGGLHC